MRLPLQVAQAAAFISMGGACPLPSVRPMANRAPRALRLSHLNLSLMLLEGQKEEIDAHVLNRLTSKSKIVHSKLIPILSAKMHCIFDYVHEARLCDCW